MGRLAITACVLVVCGCGMAAKVTGRASEVADEAPPAEVAKTDGALATKPGAAVAPASAPAAAAATTPGGATTSGLATQAIEEAVGLTGATMPDGVFRITKPRGDLKVALDGFPVTPRMGLAGWVGFRAHASGAFLVGVMPVAADELPSVMSALVNAGLEPSALHPHFVGEEPRIAFVHFSGVGSPVALARGVRDVLEAMVRVRTARPQAPRTTEIRSDLDVAKLDAALRLHGEHDGQVYRVAAPRPELRFTEAGVELGATLAPTSWAAFQGTGERAAVAGEILVLPTELQPVLHALREAHVGVVAIHDDGLRGDPRVGTVAFWGVGRPEALATGVRRALDQLATPGG